MKRIIRDPSRYFKAVAFNAFTDINPTRLKLIAAVALEFTSLEEQVDDILREMLQIFEDTEIISRINGFDGKIAILKSLTRQSPTLKGEPASLIANTLGELGPLKTSRDAVIHASIHRPEAIIARTSIKHGKPYEVDISVRTLRALLRRMSGLQIEMIAVARVTQHHFTEFELEDVGYNDPSEVTNGKPFRQHLAQLRRRQSRRKSLPPIPKLPEEPETGEAT